jgi:hypothetical protein
VEFLGSAEQKTLGIPNRSAEEKNARNSVAWNKKRRKLLDFCSEPFCESENSQNSIPNRSAEEKMLGITFLGKK